MRFYLTRYLVRFSTALLLTFPGWSIPETIRLQVGSHMSDELFYVILYYAQWFILISLALAVRGFIRYCNKMYVKEVMAAKEQA